MCSGSAGAREHHHLQREQRDSSPTAWYHYCVSGPVHKACACVRESGAHHGRVARHRRGVRGGISLPAARALSLTARSAEELAAAARTGRARHRRATSPTTAVRRAVVERTLERFGRIDMLINNAGRGPLPPRAGRRRSDDGAAAVRAEFLRAARDGAAGGAAHARRRAAARSSTWRRSRARVTLPWLTLYSASKYGARRADRRAAHGTAPAPESAP